MMLAEARRAAGFFAKLVTASREVSYALAHKPQGGKYNETPGLLVVVRGLLRRRFDPALRQRARAGRDRVRGSGEACFAADEDHARRARAGGRFQTARRAT